MGWTPGKKHNDFALPLVRDVSSVISSFPSAKMTPDPGQTLLLPQWGLLTILDLVFSPSFWAAMTFAYLSLSRETIGLVATATRPVPGYHPASPSKFLPLIHAPRDGSIFLMASSCSHNRNHQQEPINMPASFPDASRLDHSDSFMAQ